MCAALWEKEMKNSNLKPELATKSNKKETIPRSRSTPKSNSALKFQTKVKISSTTYLSGFHMTQSVLERIKRFLIPDFLRDYHMIRLGKWRWGPMVRPFLLTKSRSIYCHTQKQTQMCRRVSLSTQVLIQFNSKMTMNISRVMNLRIAAKTKDCLRITIQRKSLSYIKYSSLLEEEENARTRNQCQT